MSSSCPCLSRAFRSILKSSVSLSKTWMAAHRPARSVGSRQSGCFPAAANSPTPLRIATRLAGNDHVLVLAAGAVDNGDRLAARRRGNGGGNDHFRGWHLVGCGSIVAGMLLAIADGSRLDRHFGERAGGDYRLRLAAQRIVDEDRPDHHCNPNQPKHARQNLRSSAWERPRSLAPVLAEGGVQVIRYHGRNPRESSAELARDESSGVGHKRTGRPLGRPAGIRSLNQAALSSAPGSSHSAGTPN